MAIVTAFGDESHDERGGSSAEIEFSGRWAWGRDRRPR